MAYDIVQILDTIRASSSTVYQDRIPSATQTSLTTIGQVLTQHSDLVNEFVSALVNRIAFTVVRNKIAQNPLAVLKKGGVPLGTDVQEIFNNPAKAKTYTMDSTELLTSVPPDTKALYYRVNREDKYEVSVKRQQLRQAFVNEATLSTFIDSVISTMYSGDNIDEFILSKNVIKKAYTSGHITEVKVFDENDTTNTGESIAKNLVKNIKTYSNLFKFPSSNYNKYAYVTSDAKPVITFTPMEDQILLLDSAISANIDVEVLSYAFNIDKSQIQARTMEVDNFNGAPILGMLCDKAFFQIYDNLFELSSFPNPDNLDLKYWLHHWQTYGYSLFANAVVFTYTPKTV
jgi:hypothetical protein